ncbi:MAG: L,D-transpeptidase [Actinomycetota bacterium]|nr:L,D-transpeptidase [Actinomycetota bacterium]
MRRGSWLGRRRARTPMAGAALLVGVFTWLAMPGVAHASEHYLDINVSEQVLSEVVDGQVVDAIHISTGSGESYWYEGEWWVAETPRGWFEVYAKEPGWVDGPLGALYDPLYFYEGYAVHGSSSVPDYPASHGCVRVPLGVADSLYDRIDIGTPVFVHD